MRDDKKYGLPKIKKFPMPDASHVRSAIKFFNYVSPTYEKELARAILNRIDEYHIDINDISVGDNNRFKKYISQDTLKHHGIKGMHWGVRRYQNNSKNGKKLSKVDRKYDKLAKKDAREYAKAKMSYGEGAGNRRKLINAKVNQRRKENEHYNKMFDEYLSLEDMSKHASAAKRNRTFKDTAKVTKKTARTALRLANTVAPLLHSNADSMYLMHHGIKGMHWGVRRYQNSDGTLTKAGRVRQAKNAAKTGENYRGPRNNPRYQKKNKLADKGDIIRAKSNDSESKFKTRNKIAGRAITAASLAVMAKSLRGWNGVVVRNAGVPVASFSPKAIQRGLTLTSLILSANTIRRQRAVAASKARETSKRKDDRWADGRFNF